MAQGVDISPGRAGGISCRFSVCTRNNTRSCTQKRQYPEAGGCPDQCSLCHDHFAEPIPVTKTGGTITGAGGGNSRHFTLFYGRGCFHGTCVCLVSAPPDPERKGSVNFSYCQFHCLQSDKAGSPAGAHRLVRLAVCRHLPDVQSCRGLACGNGRFFGSGMGRIAGTTQAKVTGRSVYIAVCRRPPSPVPIFSAASRRSGEPGRVRHTHRRNSFHACKQLLSSSIHCFPQNQRMQDYAAALPI